MSNNTSITCPGCKTVYGLPADDIGEGGRVVRCAICNHSFAVRRVMAAVVPDAAGLAIDDEPFEMESAAEDIPFEKQQPEDLVDDSSEEPFAVEEEISPEEPSDVFGGEDLIVESGMEEQPDASGGEELVVDSPEEEGEGIEVGEYQEPEETFEDASVDGEELVVGETEGATVVMEAIETGDVAEQEQSDSGSEISTDEVAEDTPDAGVVEFFVEDEAGEINRVETHPADEPKKVAKSEDEASTEDEETVRAEAQTADEEPDDVMKHPPAPDAPVPQPQPPEKVAAAAEKTASAQPRQSARWRDPGKGTKRRTLLESEADAAPSSGILYHFVLLFIGAGALLTNFIAFDIWRFDPVWSCTIILMAVLGFFMQNLSGLYIAGFFSLFYAFALFSTQRELLERSEFLGVMHLGIIIALAFVFLLVYYVLMNRKRGHFVLKEGSGQSYVALIIGLITALVAFWAHMDSNSIAPLGKWLINGFPIEDFTYYAGVNLAVVFQAALLSLAIAYAISARRVRNRILLLAALGAFLGFLALLLLYAPLVVGEISFFIPV